MWDKLMDNGLFKLFYFLFLITILCVAVAVFMYFVWWIIYGTLTGLEYLRGLIVDVWF